MKFSLTSILAVLLIVPACSRNEPRNTQAASEQQQTNSTDQMKNARDQYVNDMEARLSEFDKKVDGLTKRTDTMTGTQKSNFKGSVDQLRDARKEVAKKLDDLKGVSAESWMTMKGEVDSAMAGLEHAYNQVSNTNPTPNAR